MNNHSKKMIKESLMDWLDDMKNGASCFEGFILNVDSQFQDVFIKNKMDKKYNLDFSTSVWSNDVSEDVWIKDYDPISYLDFYHSKKITELQVAFDVILKDYKLSFKLMFCKPNVIILCFREALFQDSQKRILCASQIMWDFFQEMQGECLFIGPENLDYPTSCMIFPPQWIKIQ